MLLYFFFCTFVIMYFDLSDKKPEKQMSSEIRISVLMQGQAVSKQITFEKLGHYMDTVTQVFCGLFGILP